MKTQINNRLKMPLILWMIPAVLGLNRLLGDVSPSPGGKSPVEAKISTPASFLGTHNSERLGYCISGLGDVNGDGFDDFGIGAYHHVLKMYDERDIGAVYIILGKSSGWITEENLKNHAPAIIGKSGYDDLGYAIGNNGDANGDGFNDLLIGAVMWLSKGRAYLIFGKQSADWGSGFTAEDNADVILEGESNNSLTGRSVDFIGDMNNDGCDEFLVTANAAGKVYLVKGKKSGWTKRSTLSTAQAIFLLPKGNPEYEPGCVVKGLGDVNGDKIPDFVIGYQHFYQDTGRVYLILGRKAMDWGKNFNLNIDADVIITPEANWQNAGREVAAAGDVNGDGYKDFFIGAPTYPSGYSGDENKVKGKAYLILGNWWWPKTLGLSGSNGSWIGAVSCDFLGNNFAGGLDFNGDNYSDFVISAEQSDMYFPPAGGAGKIYRMYGRSEGFPTHQSLAGYTDLLEGEQNGNQLGKGLDNVGDVNGDGTPDYAVSGPWWSPPSDGNQWGKVYLMFPPKQKWVVRGTATYRTGKTVFRAAVKVNGDSAGYSRIFGKYALPVGKSSSPVISMGRTHGTGMGDTTVTFYDAALVARHIAKLEQLAGDPLKVADTNGDGAVTIADAADIARFAVGIHGGGATRAGDWYFEPSSRTYAGISSDQADQHYTGYIRGDVNGNWGNGLPKPSGLLSNAIEKAVIWNGDTLSVEFRLSRPVPMWSFDLGLEYEQRNLSYIGYETGDACLGFTIFDNAQAGVMRIGGYRTEGPDAEGRLVILKFQNQTGNRISDLLLRKAQIDQSVIDRDVELLSKTQFLPMEYGLLRSYPNPFNNRTVVEYAVEQDGPVRLGVYDVLGRRVRILEDGKQSAGLHRAAWDGTDGEGRAMPSGMYVARMEQGGKSKSIKMIFMK